LSNTNDNSLPVDACLPDLKAALAGQREQGRNAVLQAAPGAGKTTRVPPALLGSDWLGDQRILMLEPRRLAARSAARFMAQQRGEQAGKTVGYRTRLDSQISGETRIEVVTEGVLTRLIQADPELSGYGLVIFDEFHERSLQADLGLALTLECQQALRPDLRIVVMSATLDMALVAELLGQAPVIQSDGRSFPVETRYLGKGQNPPVRGQLGHLPGQQLPQQMAKACLQAIREESGSILAFLPGMGEIRRTAALLESELPEEVQLAPLHGSLPPAEQDRAIQPAPAGRRKLVLSTDIAQTSLTIEGIRVVIDGGLNRRAAFDPNSGMSRLITGRLSQADAEQRRGRAGRLAPGVCYRLWSESEHAALAPFSPPEIQQADLAPLVLELAQWGCQDPNELRWLDPPPQAHWQQAQDLLQSLEALNAKARITEHGRAMRQLGLHPRLAHMAIRAQSEGLGPLAVRISALLSERDPLGPKAGADLETRLRALMAGRLPSGPMRQLKQSIRQLERSLKLSNNRPDSEESSMAGRVLALAFPDRIARKRPGGRARYQLSNGRGAVLDEADPLGGEDWLVVAELDGQNREARIFLAAAISETELREALSHRIHSQTVTDWDEQREQVIAREETCLGALVLSERRLPDPGPEAVQAGLMAAIRRKGLDCLPWQDNSQQYLARLAWLHQLWPDQWPDVSDTALLDKLEDWLGPFVSNARRLADLKRIPLIDALRFRLPHAQQGEVDQLLPPRLTIPTGQSVRLDYRQDPSQASGPVLATKLQALFGMTETPMLANGRLPVVFHLLSPAGRPLAVTSDLASFWANAYPEVRKDMRGRYPKHPWPEDPLTAPPTQRTKRRS